MQLRFMDFTFFQTLPQCRRLRLAFGNMTGAARYILISQPTDFHVSLVRLNEAHSHSATPLTKTADALFRNHYQHSSASVRRSSLTNFICPGQRGEMTQNFPSNRYVFPGKIIFSSEKLKACRPAVRSSAARPPPGHRGPHQRLTDHRVGADNARG